DSAAGMIAYNLHAEDFHFVVIGDEQFDKALCIALRYRPGNAAVIKRNHLIVDILLMRLSFVEAHPGHFGLQEHDRANVFINKLARGVAEYSFHGVPAFKLAYIDQRNISSDIPYSKDI